MYPLVLLTVALHAGASERQAVQTTLEVTAGNGRVDTAYVAVYREEDPWDRPRSEHEVTGGVAAVTLHEGTNFVLVAAPGFASKLIGVQGGKSASNLLVPLDDTVPITGSVSDESGNPIANARVVAEQPAYSPRALFYTGTRETVTAADGAWSLRSPRQGNAFIVKADGYGATVVVQKDDSSRGTDVILRRAVPLRLEYDRVDPDMTVTLRHEGKSELSASLQDQVWARAIDAQSITWRTVPPGAYRILLRHRDPTRFQHDEPIGRVLLSHDEVVARVAVPAPAAPENAHLEILVRRAEGDGPMPYRTTETGAIEDVDSASVPVVGGFLMYLKATDPRRIVIPTRTHILLPRIIEGWTKAALLPVSSHPRADASLRVRAAEPGGSLPLIGNVEYHQCGRAFRGFLGFRIDREGFARFAAPADCRRLILRWQPYEPIVVERQLPAGKETSLGEFLLRASGAAEIRVVRGKDRSVLPGADIRVLLHPDDEIAVAGGASDTEGRLVVEKLPVGRLLYVEARDRRTALTGNTTVELAPGERKIVDPVIVPEPATLAVRPKIAASFLERYPNATVNRIEIESLDRQAAERKHKSPLSAEGEATFGNLRPGRWKILAIVYADSLRQPIDVEEIALAPGEERVIEPDIRPALFTGRVTYRERGIAGILTVTDVFGIGRVFEVAHDGSFTVMLSERGVYEADFRVGLPPPPDVQRIDVGQISFEDPSKPVEISLTLGGIRVRVHDRHTGGPAQNVEIRLTSRENGVRGVDRVSPFPKKTDARGEVEYDALRPGTWLIEARTTDDATYAQKSVVLAADAAVTVELELERSEQIRGVVRNASGQTVSDARIQCAFVGNAGLPERTNTRTEANGAFAIRVKPAAAASCAAVTPSRRLATYRLRPGEAQIDFVFPEQSGGLVIDNWWSGSDDALWLVAQDGSVVPLAAIGRITWQLGSSLTIAGLAPGRWRIIRIPTIDALLKIYGGQSAGLPAMASVDVTPGLTANIDLEFNH